MSVHGGGACSGGSGPGGGCPTAGGQEVPAQGRGLRPSGMATAAGGMHPTGMHSCFYWVNRNCNCTNGCPTDS